MNRTPASPHMDVMDVKEFLRPVLFGLTEEDLDELAQAAIVRSFPAGAVICQEGERGEVVYVVYEGRVEISKRVDEDSERYLTSSGPGALFGEIAILQEGFRTATVRAAKPTTVLEIGQKPFFAVLGRNPSLGVRILVNMSGRLREVDQQAIADLREVNEQLKRALRKMERLDQTKSDFIRVSAHELRTPVASLLGYAQMMEGNAKVQEDPELGTLVQGVVTGTQRLHRVFNTILDLSRVMTGALQIRRSPVSIPVIFDGVLLHFERAITERNLAVDQGGLRGLPLYPGDPDLLYKVFFHLVNNAIKYTPDGGRITVTACTVEAPELGPCIEVSIEDTGIGIAPQDLGLIFEKFYRTGEPALHSSGTTTFKAGGPGLGLAIARGGVLAHGGHIWAESSGYDEVSCPGSRFVVQLPLPGEG
jgi:signal transduction histidine kinase